MLKLFARLLRRHLRDVLKSRYARIVAGAGVALLLSWPAQAATTFQDSIFLPAANWTTTTYVFGSNGGSSVTAQQSTDQGHYVYPQTSNPYPNNLPNTQFDQDNPNNSPPYYLPAVTNHAVGLATNTYLAHTYFDVYDNLYTTGTPIPGTYTNLLGIILYHQLYYITPTTPLGAITVSLDYRCGVYDGFTTTCTGAEGQAFGPAIRQGGFDYYYAPSPYTQSNPGYNTPTDWPNNPWATATFANVTANQFCKVANNQGLVDCSSHPDFTSATAQPIQCGFYTNISNQGAPHYNYREETGYNNWSCSFQPPSSLWVSKDVYGPTVTGYTMPAFPITVKCTNPASGPYYPNPVGNATPGVLISPLTVGSVCTFIETPLPPPPAPPPGCTWLAPVYHPANPNGPGGLVTIASGQNYATVTNQYTCAAPPPPGSLTVKKIVQGPNANPLSPMPQFPVTVTCKNPSGVIIPPSPYNLNVQGNNVSAPINNLPPGSQCQVLETGFPNPPPGCTWQGPIGYSPSPNIIIASGPNMVTVTNTYTCGSVVVKKIVIDDTPAPGTTNLPATYPMALTCGNGALNFQLPNNVHQSFAEAPGSLCTLTENGGNPLPPIMSHSCAIAGLGSGLATWTTTYSSNPTNFVVPGIGSANLTVTNTLKCANPSTGSLTVVKGFYPPDPAGIASTVTFNIQVTCTPPSPYPATVLAANLAANNNVTGQKNFPGVIAGSSCVVTQDLPSVGATFNYNGQVCTWQTPITEHVPAGATVAPMSTLLVFNSYKCAATPWNNPAGRTVQPPPTPPGVCPDGQPQAGGVCALHCTAPMVANKDGTACKCPPGTKLDNGVCVDKKSGLGNVLNHVTIGVGVGGGSSGGSKGGGTSPTPPPPPTPGGH